MSKLILALGYPIGFSPINNTDFFNIQLKDRMYPVNLIGTYLWLSSLDPKSPEDAKSNAIKELKIRGYDIGRDYEQYDIDNMYNLLLKNNLIIEFNKDDHSELIHLFDKISNSQFLRKGFGIGIENNEIFILYDKNKHSITPTQYLIWQLSDSTKTFSEIYNIAIKNIEHSIGCNKDLFNDIELKSLLLEDIIYLYKKDLISIISI